MRFDRYTVILMTLRPDAPTMTDDQARGPLMDQDDESFRGFSIWSVDQATARAHAEATTD